MDPKLTAALERHASDLGQSASALATLCSTIARAGIAEPPSLYTPEQAARVLSIGRSETYKLIKSKRLRSVQIGRLRRIPSTAIADLIAEMEGER